MEEDRRFYVYEWYNVEDETVFYVGKGTKGRCNSISTRTKYFKNYYNKHVCKVRIIKNNLTKYEALDLEKELILRYRLIGQAQTNFTDGGENAPVLSGSANGMYGKTHTPEVKEMLRIINSDGRNKGENNKQFGISPSERMDEETYNSWREKHKISLSGENNPQFGISPKERMDEETYLIWVEKHRIKKTGPSNPNSKKIEMFDKELNFIRKFDYIVDCVSYLIENNITKSKDIPAIRSGIWKSATKNVTYYEFYFRYANT